MAGEKFVTGHSVYIADRGGKVRIGGIERMTRVKWGRIRDDISEASFLLTGTSCSDQADFLGSLEPGRHEVVVYRGDERVWEGPLNRVAYTADGIEVFAKDVVYYLYRTVLHAGYSSAYPNIESVVNRAHRIIVAELARKEALSPPINVVPHLVRHDYATDAKTSRITTAYQKTLFGEIDDMATHIGMDYTAVGRAIHLWDVSRPLGQTQTVTESDFLGPLNVSVYGSELATRAYVSNGDNSFGVAGGIDPYYGEWETLASAYDEEGGETAPSSAEMDSQAQRNLAGRNPTPLQVRVPDNSSIDPNGVLKPSDLVPGVYIPVRATLTARKIQQMQKLNRVDFTETDKGENITVVLFPAAKPDEEES